MISPNQDLIKVYWSKEFVTAVRKTNNHPYNSDKIDLVERCVTFDGSQRYCSTGRPSFIRAFEFKQSQQGGRGGMRGHRRPCREGNSRGSDYSPDDSLLQNRYKVQAMAVVMHQPEDKDRPDCKQS